MLLSLSRSAPIRHSSHLDALPPQPPSRATWRLVAQAVRRLTCKATMLWAPNEGGGYPFTGVLPCRARCAALCLLRCNTMPQPVLQSGGSSCPRRLLSRGGEAQLMGQPALCSCTDPCTALTLLPCSRRPPAGGRYQAVCSPAQTRVQGSDCFQLDTNRNGVIDQADNCYLPYVSASLLLRRMCFGVERVCVCVWAGKGGGGGGC
jgi:hypothetical protein